MYINGQHVAKNMDLAIEFLRRGADLDDAECMNLLGLYYATGEGVPKDELRAYVWLTLASSKDHQYAKFRDQIEAKLNGEQKADGQRMAREVYEKHRMLLIQSK